jgi:hypothetical protein
MIAYATDSDKGFGIPKRFHKDCHGCIVPIILIITQRKYSISYLCLNSHSVPVFYSKLGKLFLLYLHTGTVCTYITVRVRS